MLELALGVYAKSWSYEGNTGRILHVHTDPQSTDDDQGNPPVKVSGSAVLFDKIVAVPGIYELQYSVVSRQGRAALGLSDLRFVEPFTLPDRGSVAAAASADKA